MSEREQPTNEDRERPPTVDTPRIWAASLLDYNNGYLHGRWIDATQDPDDIQAEITAMLAESPTTAQTGQPAEEWAIHDFDGFGDLRIDEHESISYIAKVAAGITEHGLAFAAYADVMQDEDALAGFEDSYLGHYDSTEAYAQQMVDDLGYDELLNRAVPESFRAYVRIDVEQLARDLHYGGDIHAVRADDDGVWIFAAQ